MGFQRAGPLLTGLSVLKGPWTAGRSNQSILREINPEYSLEELMLLRVGAASSRSWLGCLAQTRRHLGVLVSDQVHGEGALHLGCHCPEDSQVLPDGQVI